MEWASFGFFLFLKKELWVREYSKLHHIGKVVLSILIVDRGMGECNGQAGRKV